jgi:predicted amidohydrolase
MVIRIAQIRVYPVSRDLEANHSRLMEILPAVAEHQPDVVITPEGFLDGYIGKDPEVTRFTPRPWNRSAHAGATNRCSRRTMDIRQVWTRVQPGGQR